MESGKSASVESEPAAAAAAAAPLLPAVVPLDPASARGLAAWMLANNIDYEETVPTYVLRAAIFDAETRAPPPQQSRVRAFLKDWKPHPRSRAIAGIALVHLVMTTILFIVTVCAGYGHHETLPLGAYSFAVAGVVFAAAVLHLMFGNGRWSRKAMAAAAAAVVVNLVVVVTLFGVQERNVGRRWWSAAGKGRPMGIYSALVAGALALGVVFAAGARWRERRMYGTIRLVPGV